MNRLQQEVTQLRKEIVKLQQSEAITQDRNESKDELYILVGKDFYAATGQAGEELRL